MAQSQQPLVLTEKGKKVFGSESEVLRAIQNAKPLRDGYGNHGIVSMFKFSEAPFAVKTYKQVHHLPESGDAQAAEYARIIDAFQKASLEELMAANYTVRLKVPEVYAFNKNTLVMELVPVKSRLDLMGSHRDLICVYSGVYDKVLASTRIPLGSAGKLFVGHVEPVKKQVDFFLLDPNVPEPIRA